MVIAFYIIYYFITLLCVDIMNTSIKIIERFNGFARIWIGRKPLVLISDPEHLQIYYTNPTMIDRADQYNHIGQVLGKDSILVANGSIDFYVFLNILL